MMRAMRAESFTGTATRSPCAAKISAWSATLRSTGPSSVGRAKAPEPTAAPTPGSDLREPFGRAACWRPRGRDPQLMFPEALRESLKLGLLCGVWKDQLTLWWTE